MPFLISPVSHCVVDRRGVHMDTAVVLGHEAELVGFGLHLHRSFARHLVIPLRSSHLEPKDQIKKKKNRSVKPGRSGNMRQLHTHHWP